MTDLLPHSNDELIDSVWRTVLPDERAVRRARRRLHRKALTISAILVCSYAALVVADFGLFARIVAAAALVAGLVALGTCVMHDANHGSFSRRRWVNRVLSCTSDALGASSWLWRIQHNRLHHGNTNVVGYDADIELSPWARVAPAQPWHPRYRWQHIYIWPLYGVLSLKNLLVSDLLSLVHGKVGQQPLRRAVTSGVVARITLGKLTHLTWALAVPLLFNPWYGVLAFYVVCSWLVGFSLALIFQLAHCVETAQTADAEPLRRGVHHAAHQLRTTVDIACPAPFVGRCFRWIAGGLDHQIEHHLAPGLPHTIYPEIAKRFRAECAKHQIAYHLHPGVMPALKSHARWLREMGRPPTVSEAS